MDDHSQIAEDRLLHYVKKAIELRDAGETVDFEDLCRDDPGLIEEVRETLGLEDMVMSPPTDGLVGETLAGRYTLHECIGLGAMGTVYEATDCVLQRTVAVKILPPGFLRGDHRRERFLREARVLATLNHPHIVPVHDFGVATGGLHFLVMERLLGHSLASVTSPTHLPADGRLPPAGWLQEELGLPCRSADFIPQITAWMLEVVQALRAAHEIGVCHRDVKPSNVFLTREGKAVLIDFGIAARSGDATMTTRGSALGTPAYMAPEQVARDESASPTMDVYGVCATLYHLVSRQPPYPGGSVSVLAKLQREEPRPLRSIDPTLPIDLCAIIEKGLEHDVERRYQTMAELEADLRAFLAHRPVTARPITTAARLWRRLRRRPAPVLVPASIAAAAAVAFWLAAARSEAAVRRDIEHRQLFAAIAPSVALEGTVERRQQMNREERAGFIAQLDAVLELDPGDVYSRTLRAGLHLDQGNATAATADIAAIVGSPPSTYEQALLMRYRALGPGQAGIAALRLSDMPAPTTATGRFLAGFHQHRRNEWTAADATLAGAPDYLPARYLRLSVQLHLGLNADDRAAKEEILRALCQQASDLEDALGGPTARTTYVRGTALCDLGDHEAGTVELERSRALQPDSFGTLFNLADGYRVLGQLALAESTLRDAAAIRPWLLNARLQLAVVLGQQGRFDAGIECLDTLGDGDLATPVEQASARSFIETQRLLALLGEHRHDEAVDTARRLFAICEQAMQATPAPSTAQASAFGYRRLLARLLLDDNSQHIQVVLHGLESDPLDHDFLSATAAILDRHGFADDKLTRDIFARLVRVLRTQAARTAPRNH
ncbi:MAG: protein kinase [Planctomycetes bacterium]|nr:protein kinase [Planctomycetota bacterium]